MTIASTASDELSEGESVTEVVSDRPGAPTLVTRARDAFASTVLPRLRRVPPIEWVGLATCLTPIVAAVVRAFGADWRPVYDSSYFTTRSLDVLTEHHPFTGSWSTFGAVLDESINNTGSLQLLLLAPFTRIDAYIGTAVGIALVNALSVAAVWFTSRRLFGTRGVIAVMVATAVLELSFGAPAFVDARQQHALLLPFWAMLWLTADLSRGSHRAVLPWVATGSLVLQTHFSYAYLVGAMVVAGVGGYVHSNRTVLRTRAFVGWATAGVFTALLLWSHTIWDQVFGTGNFGRVLSHAGGAYPAGWSTGARIVADSPFGYPFWWPGSVRDFHEPWTFRPAFAWIFVAGWLVILFAAASSTRRRRDRLGFRLALLSFVVVVAALASAARIPPSSLDSLPQTYFWLWPVSLFAAVAIAKAFAQLLPATHNASEALAVVATVAAAFALPDRYVFPPWQIAGEINDAGGRRMLDDIADTLDDIDFDLGAAVVVDDVTFRLLVPDYYNILGEFTQHGLDVHFPASSPDLQRFGHDRCEDGEERWRLNIVVGGNRPTLDALDVVLADISRADYRDELIALDQQMLQRVYSGEIEVDRDALPAAGLAGQLMTAILDTPDEPHSDLWFSLFVLVEEGIVDVPPQLRGEYRRWSDLARANIASNVLVILRPNYFPTDGCPG